MSDLENTLKELDKPRVQVPSFKQDLRRALIEESRRRSADSFYKPAFYGALFTCSALATVLILLLLNPSVLNSSGAPGEKILPEGSGIAEWRGAEVGGRDAGYASPASYDGYSDARIFQAADPKYDKAYLEQLFQDKLSTSPGPIRPTNSEKVMILREYELADGQRVWVYTEVPPERKVQNNTAYETL